MKIQAATLALSFLAVSLAGESEAQTDVVKTKRTGRTTLESPQPAAPAGNGSQITGAASTTEIAPRPLASHPEGQAMMAKAAENAGLLEVKFVFLNKTYKNDQYVKVAGKKVRTSCIRFKATSGFWFDMDEPKFTLNSQGLRIEQNISRIRGDGLAARFQLGPCSWAGYGIGVQLSDVKVVYRSRPVVSFSSDGACTVHWNQDTDDTTITIGDLNILGVQNNIDKLAKDAAREALNAALEGFYGVLLRNELLKVSAGTCGGKKG